MIVLDRDSKFTSALQRHLLRNDGTKLKFTSASHFQIEGEAERVNGVCNQYLRNLVSVNKIGQTM